MVQGGDPDDLGNLTGKLHATFRDLIRKRCLERSRPCDMLRLPVQVSCSWGPGVGLLRVISTLLDVTTWNLALSECLYGFADRTSRQRTVTLYVPS